VCAVLACRCGHGIHGRRPQKYGSVEGDVMLLTLILMLRIAYTCRQTHMMPNKAATSTCLPTSIPGKDRPGLLEAVVGSIAAAVVCCRGLQQGVVAQHPQVMLPAGDNKTSDTAACQYKHTTEAGCTCTCNSVGQQHVPSHSHMGFFIRSLQCCHPTPLQLQSACNSSSCYGDHCLHNCQQEEPRPLAAAHSPKLPPVQLPR
jgi:hypothetical protein